MASDDSVKMAFISGLIFLKLGRLLRLLPSLSELELPLSAGSICIAAFSGMSSVGLALRLNGISSSAEPRLVVFGVKSLPFFLSSSTIFR